MRDGTQTKEQIQRAALELFVHQGVDGTTIKEIAGRAGISQGAMYNHYASKDDLAWDLFSDNYNAIGKELRRLSMQEGSVEDRIRAMIRYIYGEFDKDWVRFSYIFFVRHMFLKNVTPRMGNPYEVFRALIARAIRHGEIPRQDPDVATSMVTGVINQVADTKILGRIKPDMSQLADDVATACIRMLRG